MSSRGAFTISALLWCSVFFSGSTFSSSARADEDATRIAARALGTEGVNAYLDEDYGLALSRLESAYAVLRVPSLALWSARTLEKNGQLIEASERYLEATKLELGAEGNREVQKQAQKDAATELAALLPRIPSVTIHLRGREPEDVELSVGGQPVSSGFVSRPHPTNPGQTEVIAKSAGLIRRQIVNLSEGEALEVTFQFPAARKEPPRENEHLGEDKPVVTEPLSESVAQHPSRAWQRPAGWVGLGVGGAGIIFGAITGALALSAFSNFDCQDKYCPGATDKEIATYNTERALSSVGLIAGGVVAGAGLTLLLSAPSKERAPSKEGAPFTEGAPSTEGASPQGGAASNEGASQERGASVMAFFALSSVGVRGNF